MAQSLATMSVEDAIYGRASVRAFQPEPVDQPTLRKLLAAAVRAPTAMHGEPWQFLVVQDRDTLLRLSCRAKARLSAEADRLHPDHRPEALTQPEFNLFYDAGTLVLICARTAAPFAAADCWLAAQNLMLAAHAMGLGCCVIGSALAALNLPEVRQELGLPQATVPVAPIIVGRPLGEVRPSSRKEPQVLAWL